jgi:dGTPase
MQEDIPFKDILGQSHSQRINTLITDVVASSAGGGISMSPGIERAFDGLNAFMFDSVYTNPVAKGEEIKAKYIVSRLYEYYMGHTELLGAEYREICVTDGDEAAAISPA